MLDVQSVNVYRGKSQTLWDVSMNVEQGEVIAIIGANGAGKTTLLSTIAGLLQPSSGTILFHGREIQGLSPNQVVGLGAAYVPEDRKLFAHMKVCENLDLGAYVSRAKARREETFELIYELLPVLKERKNQLARTLSGGEQKMLTIARGLASCPELLMLDEPSQGLSPKLTMEVFKTIGELKDHGISILLAEQNVHYALKYADRGYVMETGKVTLEGNGTELLKNQKVKEAFLGL
ncbi:MAG: ABC transporter ATP-binding protein [Candidatus Odinarchaeota archaeon]